MRVIEGGIYFLFDKDELVYVGESDNIYRRVGQHIYKKDKKFDRFEIYPTRERKKLEGFLIRTLTPKYNVAVGAWDDNYGSDVFLTQSVEEAINKYKEKHKDMTIKELADMYSVYADWMIHILHKHNAAIYKIDGIFYVDRKWVETNEQNIKNWLQE